MPAGAESDAHRQLKALAAAWALAQGFDALAEEVALPRASYRADLLAARTRGEDAPEIVVFECKQSRADLLQDAAPEDTTRARLAVVHARRCALETQLAVHRPDLRRGESLFPEYDRYDFTDLRHEGLRQVRRELETLQTRLYARTKFARLRRWRCAHGCYLVTAAGVCDPGEVPAGWGWLERSADKPAQLVRRRRPERSDCADPAAALAALARAATRATLRRLGVERAVRPPR
jgi:hypothetical protein